MQTQLRIRDNEICRVAVAQYVGELQQAGIAARIELNETEAQWDDGVTARVVWGHEEQTENNDEDGDGWLGDQEGADCGVAMAVAEMYTRTIAYLGSDPHAAKEWLQRRERLLNAAAANETLDRRKTGKMSRHDRTAPGTVVSTADASIGAGSPQASPEINRRG